MYTVTLMVVDSVQGQTCDVFGTDADQGSDADRARRFYLNTEDPAPCSGTVDEFQYCYYRHSYRADSYHFTFAVFRETSPGSYSTVSEAFNAVRDPNPGVLFACLSFPVVNQIQIQAGDMIGACVYDLPDTASEVRLETYVVGQIADRFLMRTGTDEARCSDSTVPSPVSSLSTVNERVLHIYANISK